MLESIFVRPASLLSRKIDVGELAEAVLFYEDVRLHIGESELAQLVGAIGLDALLALVEGPVNVTLTRDFTATHTQRVAGRTVHDFITGELGHKDKRRRSRLEIVRPVFERVTGKQGKSRRAAHRFLNHASVGSVNDGVDSQNGIADLSRNDVENEEYVRSGVAEILGHLVGQVPHSPDWVFEVRRAEDGLMVSTNLDFDEVTRLHRSRTGCDYDVTPALILDFFHKARTDLHHAARYNASMMTSPVTEGLVRTRLSGTVAAACREAASELRLFQRVVLDGRSVAEVVNSGDRSLEDILRLRDKGARFRERAGDRPQDTSLLQGYLRALETDSWLSELPKKSVRLSIIGGLGVLAGLSLSPALGAAATLGLTVADTFLLERLLAGWRPDQFVAKDLRAFVAASAERTGAGVEKTERR